MVQKTELVICFVLASLVGACYSSDTLYPFGATEGDADASDIGDDACYTPFHRTIHWVKQRTESIHVCTNGLISFDASRTTSNPRHFPQQTPMVCPFWVDVNFRINGSFWIRETSDTDLLTRASTDVRNSYSQTYATYSATWALVATWYKAPPYGQDFDSAITNTFQAVLISDGNTTFAMFNYRVITWTNVPDGDHALVGFDAGNEVSFVTLPGSLTAAIVNVVNTTNVGVPGRLIYKLGSDIPSNALCPRTYGNITAYLLRGEKTTEVRLHCGNIALLPLGIHHYKRGHNSYTCSYFIQVLISPVIRTPVFRVTYNVQCSVLRSNPSSRAILQFGIRSKTKYLEDICADDCYMYTRLPWWTCEDDLLTVSWATEKSFAAGVKEPPATFTKKLKTKLEAVDIKSFEIRVAFHNPQNVTANSSEAEFIQITLYSRCDNKTLTYYADTDSCA